MTEGKLPPAREFVNALETHAPTFGVSLSEDATARLVRYFELVGLWNPRLHLVAPCTPQEFAVRHVLESLLAARYLREGVRVCDVGSGAGLPVIPCLVLRPDVTATLVEAATKKAVFLREALRAVGRQDAAEVVNERFERLAPPDDTVAAVTCRALDRFTELFPRLVEWTMDVKLLLLFGGESLRAEIERARMAYSSLLVPSSERRFLFVVERQ
ncbi:MAG TPA: 16S rRNA (guanine(527)-N(7))-methyltransferase RsmG [Pyrinomonadaceae bacterium]|nr:16S rRNA (guanine(527)-N(7))-methyltransferase RsmG [Pyrinomonadaceae bacterium]